jgi:hypothetical protein
VFFEKKGVKLAPDMFALSTCWRPTCWCPVHVRAQHVHAWYMFAPNMLSPCTLQPLKLAPNMFTPGTCSHPTCYRLVHYSLLSWRPTCSHPCPFSHAHVVVPIGTHHTCMDSHLRLPTATLAGNSKKSYCSKVNLE